MGLCLLHLRTWRPADNATKCLIRKRGCGECSAGRVLLRNTLDRHPLSLTAGDARSIVQSAPATRYLQAFVSSVPPRANLEFSDGVPPEIARLELLFDSIPLAFATFDSDLKLASANTRYRDLTGLDEASA